MRIIASRLSLFVSLLVVPAFVEGCSSSPDASEQDEAVGTLRLPLRGSGVTGAQYRLRQALISITGPTARLHDTEANPDTFGLFFELPGGSYEVQVTGQDGENTWQLERLSDDGETWSPVDATLAPPNPVTVDVIPNGQAFVNLQFLLDSDEVVLGTGQLFISLNVEDRQQCAPFTPPTGCLSEQKCLSTLTIRDVAVCQPAGMSPLRGACTQDSDCADGHCWFFGDGHTECLPDCLPAAAPGEAGSCPMGAACSPLNNQIGDPGFGACFFF
jgi:hypothetical protein